MSTNASMLYTTLDVTAITGDVILLDGPHGIGKSEKIAGWSKERGYFCKPLFASTQEVGDLVGIPHMVNGQTVWAQPSWMAEIVEKAKQGIKSVLFLDELNRAQVDVLNACLELCLNKTMHTHKLPAGTVVVAAVNPSNGKYRTQKLDPALMNRFIHIKVESNTTEWLQWANKNDVHKTIISFISKNEDKLFHEDDKSEQSATPRSWTLLSRNMKVLETMNPTNEMLRVMFVGKLGTAIGGQFYTFYKEYAKNIEPQDVIEFIKKQKIDMSNYQGTIENISAKMQKEMLSDIEPILMTGLVEKLAKSYVSVGVNKDNLQTEVDKKAVLPLASLLYAIPLEVAAACYKQFREQKDIYDILVHCDVKKKLVTQIASIKLDIKQ